MTTLATGSGVDDRALDEGTGPGGVTTAERLECLAITASLAFAIISPGAGFLSAFLASVVIWFRHVRTWRSGTIDVLIGLAALVTLLSPFWHPITTSMTTNSLAAALSLIFFVAVRIVVTNARCFHELAMQIGVVCSIYAVYFIVNAQSYDLINDRAAVSFANANYTGAVLAFGGAATLFLAVTGPVARRGWWVAATFVLGVAIYMAGSRASFSGLLLAALVIWAWPRAPRLLHTTVLVGSVVGFFLALVPNSIDIFYRLTVLLSVFHTFERGDVSSSDASGRQEAWHLALQHVDDSWLTGWGPGNYYLTLDSDSTFGAHSWAVEYLLSVGVLGTVFLAAVLYLAYTTARSGAGGLWTTATTVALLPSLVLSTHQWTLWAWVAFALWSRADVLGVLSLPGRRESEGSTGSPEDARPEPSDHATAG